MIVQLDAAEWGAISTTAKDLVMKMLSPNPKNRPSIAEILEHPWMRVSTTLTFNPVWCSGRTES